MPSNAETLYPPRLRAWCEASACYYRLFAGTRDRDGVIAAEARVRECHATLRGLEVLAAEWIERRSSSADGLSGEAESYAHYAKILTPPAKEADRD